MSRRVVVLAMLALLAWSGLVAAASTGIVTTVMIDRFIAAPDGALAICEIMQGKPR